MKFCKTYEEYMQMQGERERQLPVLGLKNLKKILKRCRTRHENDLQLSQIDSNDISLSTSNCTNQCPVCDGSFFPALLMEMYAVLGCFNEHAQNLLDVHLATGFKRFCIWCKGKLNDRVTLIKEDQQLLTYALINAVAVRKILKKYDKVHYSKQGQEFKSRVQKMHIEILHSPFLCELMALQINLREEQVKKGKAAASFDWCSLILKDDKPLLTCELFYSIKLDIDLTCSICLEPVFDPVGLTCGHIFCYICACSAASVTIVDGLKTADMKKACPLCREAGVYDGAVHLEELNILLSQQ